MKFGRDTRAQSITYLKAAATFILFAGFYAVFQEPVAKLLTASGDITTTSQAATGRGYISSMWEWLPLAVLGLLVIWVLASSIRQSGGGL